jgi:hypothetical protein
MAVSDRYQSTNQHALPWLQIRLTHNCHDFEVTAHWHIFDTTKRDQRLSARDLHQVFFRMLGNLLAAP